MKLRKFPLAAAVVAVAVAHPFAQGAGAGDGFWQGSWGIEGKSPYVTITGNRVAYEGPNGQSYRVSNVSITGPKVAFQAGAAQMTLTRWTDNNIDLVSVLNGQTAKTMLCKSNATHCP
jgi:hypothetical protein